MGALIFAHERESLLGDPPHRLLVLVQPQVEDRAHMQAADGGMSIPRATRAVFFEHLREALGVFGKVLERYRAVLHEADRVALLFHGHHAVATRDVYVLDGGLQFWIDHIDSAPHSVPGNMTAITDAHH